MSLDENVVMFPGVTSQDYDPIVMLEAAMRTELADVVIIGWDTDGDFFFSSSKSEGPEVLWMLELAKSKLMDIGKGE